jgi:hypothetical protein
MSKTRQNQRKKARLARERTQTRSPAPNLGFLNMLLRPLSPEELESERIVDERLAKKFGAKDEYEDWEIKEAMEELEAEGVLPDLSHLD